MSEGGQYALAFSSGMAAIDTVLRLVKPGEQVAVAGHARLRDGMKVRLAPDSGASP